MLDHSKSFSWKQVRALGTFASIEDFTLAKKRYLDTMNETEQQAIYRLNKYCLVNWWDNPFSYLDDLLLSPEIAKYSEYNFAGGRFGRKTYEISHYIAKRIAIGFKYGLTTAIYGFRLYGADILELKKEIVKALNDYGIRESKTKTAFNGGEYIYSGQNNTPYFKFVDGSFIYLKGIYKSTDRAIALKGLASAQGKDLAIIWQEEANEFSNAETQAIRMAVRDAKKRIYFSSSNPDELYQDFIAYCDKNARFDERLLLNNGEAFYKVLDKETERGKIFHYTNHRINPYLTKDEIVEMLELKKHDLRKYKIWGLGMPGGMEHSIFSPYMNPKPRDFQPTSFVAGIDLGYATSQQGHPTRAILSAVNIEPNYLYSKPRVHPVAEYYHSNATMVQKNSEQINDEIIQFFIQQANKYPLLRQQGLNVRVDYGSGGLYVIDRLNAISRLTRDTTGYLVSEWLHFEPTDKKVWFIKDRIDITVSLLSKQIFTLNEQDTPWLFKEMKMIQWQKKRTLGADNTPKMLDLNDDGWDAFMYSIMPIIDRLMRDFRESKLFNKQYQLLKRSGSEIADDINW